MSTNQQTAALEALDAGGVSSTLKAGDFLAGAKIIPFTVEKLSTTTDGDEIQIVRVHRSWQLVGLFLDNDSLAGMSDINIGLWSDDPPATATDVDSNVYVDALDLNAGTSNFNSNYAFHTRDIAKMGQQVWQDAGAASMQEADEWYRIAIAMQTGGSATGTISGYALVGVPNL